MRNESLEARMDRLERQNRRLRRAGTALGAVALAALAAPFFMSANPVCKTVWAERFVLKDASGRQRGLWDAYTRNGNPTLQLYDVRGELSMAISLDDEGAPMLSYTSDGKLVRQPIDRSEEAVPDSDGIASLR